MAAKERRPKRGAAKAAASAADASAAAAAADASAAAAAADASAAGAAAADSSAAAAAVTGGMAAAEAAATAAELLGGADVPLDDECASEGEEDPWVDGTDPWATPSVADPPRETGTTGGHDGQAQHFPKQGQSGPTQPVFSELHQSFPVPPHPSAHAPPGFPGPHGFPSVYHGWPHPFPWHPGIYPHGPSVPLGCYPPLSWNLSWAPMDWSSNGPAICFWRVLHGEHGSEQWMQWCWGHWPGATRNQYMVQTYHPKQTRISAQVCCWKPATFRPW